MLSAGTIDLPPFSKSGVKNQRWVFGVIPDIAFRDDNHVLGDTERSETPVSYLGRPPSVDAVRHDYQYVQIAVRPHIASCR